MKYTCTYQGQEYEFHCDIILDDEAIQLFQDQKVKLEGIEKPVCFAKLNNIQPKSCVCA